MKTAVIYTRVSSKAQVKKGDGLASQESRCREFAAYKDYEVVNVFQDEGVSGGLVDRPGIKEMLGWLRKNRAVEPIVLIDDISRLARDTDVHRKLRNALGSVGAILERSRPCSEIYGISVFSGLKRSGKNKNKP